MTSTSFTIGLNERKNSSRVLKPPGGGHSDIFGINDNSEMLTPSKKMMGPPTTINSCFVHEEINAKSKDKIDYVNNGSDAKNEKNGIENHGSDTENGSDENGHATSTPDENTLPTTEEIKEVKELPTPEPPKRVRVPPGGFSSALW